jgi:uncharacterized protein (DUF1015 family)
MSTIISRGRIKIHELTREAKERDRVRHVDYTNANTGPVFLTYPAKPVIDAIIQKIVTENAPEYDFTAVDGIQHTLWLINDPETIVKLVNHFGQIPYCYVADGHHRAKSAALVGKMRREKIRIIPVMKNTTGSWRSSSRIINCRFWTITGREGFERFDS